LTPIASTPAPADFLIVPLPTDIDPFRPDVPTPRPFSMLIIDLDLLIDVYI
jgi:hypothetical protein